MKISVAGIGYVGFTQHIKEKYNYDKILFSLEFLREGLRRFSEWFIRYLKNN